MCWLLLSVIWFLWNLRTSDNACAQNWNSSDCSAGTAMFCVRHHLCEFQGCETKPQHVLFLPVHKNQQNRSDTKFMLPLLKSEWSSDIFVLHFHLFFPGFELFLFHVVLSWSMLLCPLGISVWLLYGCVQCTDLFTYPFSQTFIYFHSCCYQYAPPFPLSLRWGGANSS